MSSRCLVLGGLQPECRGAGPSLDFDGPEPPVQGGREPLRGRGCDLCPEGAGPCACAHPRVRSAPPSGCARSLDQDTAPPRGASRSGVLTSAFPSPGHQGRPLVALRNPGRHPIGGNLEQNLCHRSLGSDSRTPWTVARQAPLSKGFFQARILEWEWIPLLGDLPNPGIEPEYPTFQADSSTV